MNDLIALILPNAKKNDEILLLDMFKDVNVFSDSNKHLKIAFLEKILIIQSIYSSKMPKDNSNNCLFVPFSIFEQTQFSDIPTISEQMLKMICKKPPNIKGQILLAKRFVLDPHVNYKFILVYTEPVNPEDLKVTKTFWCNKSAMDQIYENNNYFLIGNEIEHMLRLKMSGKFNTGDDKSIIEYRFNPLNSNVSLSSAKSLPINHKVIVQSKCDKLTQNYVFADFMMNCYPCQVMCYPQFIGFAVARGYYLKRCLRLFNVLKKDSVSHMTFDEFLFGCICMDLESPHEGYIREARCDLIFKYYDYNKDNALDFSEMGCLVKRMMKKTGLGNKMEDITSTTETIFKLLDNAITPQLLRQSKVSYATFQKGINLPELKGLTNLLRFSVPYLINTKSMMEKYIQLVDERGSKIIDIVPVNSDFELIPYFIKEAYSSEQFLEAMVYHSTNYSAIKRLLEQLDERKKLAIATHKAGTIVSGLFNQVAYYLSEMAFDIYNSEIIFPLRNPIFLIVLFTAIALVDPHLFSSSATFWNNVLSSFVYNVPALIIGFKQLENRNAASNAKRSENDEILLLHRRSHWTNQQKALDKRAEDINEGAYTTFKDRLIGDNGILGSLSTGNSGGEQNNKGKDGQAASGKDPKGRDAQGYDSKGRDSKGFDKKGFDSSGYDANGKDSKGYDKKGFDSSGYDAKGRNSKGFDRNGVDSSGRDAKGKDSKRIDKNGIDSSGRDASGRDSKGFDKNGFDANGRDATGRDSKGFDENGFDSNGRDAKGRDSRGFDKNGFDSNGRDAKGRDSRGFDKNGFDSNGRDAKGYDKNGLDSSGHDAKGNLDKGNDSKERNSQGYSQQDKQTNAEDKDNQVSKGQQSSADRKCDINDSDDAKRKYNEELFRDKSKDKINVPESITKDNKASKAAKDDLSSDGDEKPPKFCQGLNKDGTAYICPRKFHGTKRT